MVLIMIGRRKSISGDLDYPDLKAMQVVDVHDLFWFLRLRSHWRALHREHHLPSVCLGLRTFADQWVAQSTNQYVELQNLLFPPLPGQYVLCQSVSHFLPLESHARRRNSPVMYSDLSLVV